MKNQTVSIFFISILLSIFGSSCKTTSLRVEVLQPAPVTIPKEIKTIAVINHSLPKSKWWNILEGILTGEMIEQDKRGKEKAMYALSQRMGQSTRFNLINTTEEIEASGSITGKSFPTPLEWATVSSICNKYKADAVLALEYFDSDFIVMNSTRMEDKDGKQVTIHIAKGIATVNIGFRMYDPAKKSIIDRESFSFTRTWEGEGRSIMDAAARLIDNAQAVYAISEEAGERYAEKVTPLYFWVNRMYYKKSKHSNDIALGYRYAAVNDWEKAEESWVKALGSRDIKTAGMASYNLAIASEVMGNLEKAKEFAQQSYTNYGNKEARDYVYILEQRINDQKKIEEQLGN